MVNSRQMSTSIHSICRPECPLNYLSNPFTVAWRLGMLTVVSAYRACALQPDPQAADNRGAVDVAPRRVVEFGQGSVLQGAGLGDRCSHTAAISFMQPRAL